MISECPQVARRTLRKIAWEKHGLVIVDPEAASDATDVSEQVRSLRRVSIVFAGRESLGCSLPIAEKVTL